MNLTTYLQLPGIRKAAVARQIGVSSAVLFQWERGIRPVPPQHCPAVELATGGQVTRQELRPEDWHQIWPELIPNKQRRTDKAAP